MQIQKREHADRISQTLPESVHRVRNGVSRDGHIGDGLATRDGTDRNAVAARALVVLETGGCIGESRLPRMICDVHDV